MHRLSLTIAALFAMAGCLQATPITFSFLGDTWTNPGGTQLGFVSQTAGLASNSSTGFVTKNGLTLTFTGSFFGTAVSSSVAGSNGQGPSFTNATSINPLGFIFGTNNDANGITFAGNSFSGLVTNYQRWDFSFSAPVVLTDFVLQDIDSNGPTGGFRDMIAAEAFQTVSPGAAGTGTGPSYSFAAPTSLMTGSVTIGGRSLASVAAPLGTGNPNNTPEVRAGISFGSTAISSFSVYAFSDRNADHRISLNSSSFEVNSNPSAIDPIPEPSSVLLGGLGLAAGMFLRRRC